MRPGDRDVAWPRGRNPRGRRGERGANRPRGDQRDNSHGGAVGRSFGRFVTARTIHRRRLRPGGRSRCGDDRPRRVRPVAERTLPLGFQHHLCDVRLRALGFISLGQTFALLLGGIDLSVGPLAGFLVVVASFFVLDGKSPGIWALGFIVMLACALGVGLLNGALIRFAKFTPVAATSRDVHRARWVGLYAA